MYLYNYMYIFVQKLTCISADPVEIKAINTSWCALEALKPFFHKTGLICIHLAVGKEFCTANTLNDEVSQACPGGGLRDEIGVLYPPTP